MAPADAAASGDAVAEADPTRRLYGLVAERLALMRDVAAYKWLHGRPVEDLDRERLVVESAVADGLRRGIRVDSSSRFFQAQIEAAKDIQDYWFARWAKDGGPAVAADLASVLRPALLELGTAIIEQSTAVGLHPSRELFVSTLAVEGLSDDRKAELFDAMTGIRRFVNRLEQIQNTGRIRVGTTGDYAPFSYLSEVSDAADGGDHFEGVDIDLARDLAASLKAELVLIKTSWPTLLADLESGAFDVGMSGISRTESRARVAYLSAPYYVGGKTPITRCEDRARFSSLEDIDQPGVRVIVNPGGTNEAFVDAHIHVARKVLHLDNRTIFSALLAGEADLMITDQIEVIYQTNQNPQLCGTVSETFTYQEKGFLMPRDDALKSYVDSWLGRRLGDGTVGRLIDQHLTAR